MYYVHGYKWKENICGRIYLTLFFENIKILKTAQNPIIKSTLLQNIFSFMLFNEILRFLSKIITDNSMKTWLLDFHCLGLLFSSLFHEFSAKSCPKGFNVVYSSEIMETMLTFRDRTADIIYCAVATLFLHTTSGGLSLTAASFLHHLLEPKF